MAGYSGTPVVRKIGVRPGDTVALVDAPAGWQIADLPEGVTIRRRAGGTPNVTIAFVRTRAVLRKRASGLVAMTRPGAMLWIAWPRKAGGHVSDLTEQSLRDVLLPTGMVDVKVAALDDDWSGLKFVWRRG